MALRKSDYWGRIGLSARRLAEDIGIDIPDELGVARGDFHRRQLVRIQATADFLEAVAEEVHELTKASTKSTSKKSSKKAKKEAPDEEPAEDSDK
jgi:hypothetical protein